MRIDVREVEGIGGGRHVYWIWGDEGVAMLNFSMKRKIEMDKRNLWYCADIKDMKDVKYETWNYEGIHAFMRREQSGTCNVAEDNSTTLA